MFRSRVLGTIVLALLRLPPVPAQVIEVSGGSSSLFEASGASIGFHSANYEGQFGAGTVNGQWQLGAVVRRHWANTTLTFGDDVIPLSLPTDAFNEGYHFLGRGASLAYKRGDTTVFAFAGATSRGFGATFFKGARAQDPAAALFFGRRLSPKFRVFSRNLFSTRMTSINGVEWLPIPDLKAAFSTGIGANHGYLASSLTYRQRWFSVKAAYVFADDQFRRVVLDQPLNSENVRENILIVFRPDSFLEFSAGRFNFLQPVDRTHPELRATLNQYSANAHFAGWKMNAKFFDSQTATGRVRATSFAVDRNFKRWLQTSAGGFHSSAEKSTASTSFVATVREVYSSRFSLSQQMNTSAGQHSVSWGGTFFSNAVSVGVSYQTIFSPFFPQHPFRQVLLLNLSVRPFGSVQLNTSTYASPMGDLKYAAYGTAFAYRDNDNHNHPAAAYRFPRYRILGRVRDENGDAVAGAAIRIEKETVISDAQGEFFLRLKKGHPCRIEVMMQEFVAPGRYQVVSSPSIVEPIKESVNDLENWVTIVVRRQTGE
jgi:hypothetical protein